MTPIKIYILLWVILCVMISWVNGRKYKNLLQFNTTRFFYKQCFFSTHPQCCLAFSWIELQMLLRCWLIHLTNIKHFIFSIFVSMSRPSSIYVVHMWSIFYFFSLVFIIINNLIKKTHLFFVYFVRLSPTIFGQYCIKKANNFQKSKVQPQGVAYILLDFFSISAWHCF